MPELRVANPFLIHEMALSGNRGLFEDSTLRMSIMQYGGGRTA